MRFTLRLEELTFYAIIGILPFERRDPQKVVIDLELEYSYKDGDYIDYAQIAALLKDHIQKKRFRLVEDALASCAELLRSRYPQIDTLRITLSKPQILPDTRPSLTLKLNFS